MDTNETAGTIAKKIQQKQLFQAEQLLQKSMTDLAEGEQKALHEEISNLMGQAKELFTEADRLEEQRKLEQSLEKYTQVESIAADYPGLPEAIQRVNDSIALVSALQHRNSRRKSRQINNDEPISAVSRHAKAWKSPGLFVAFSLLLLMIGGGVLYKNNRASQAPETKIDTALEGSAALLAEKPAEDLNKPEILQEPAAEVPTVADAEKIFPPDMEEQPNVPAPEEEKQHERLSASDMGITADTADNTASDVAVQITVPDPATTVSLEQELSSEWDPVTDKAPLPSVTLEEHIAVPANTAEEPIVQVEVADANAATEPEQIIEEERSEPGPEMSGSEKTRLLIQAQLDPIKEPPPVSEREEQVEQSVEVADTAEVKAVTRLHIQPVIDLSSNPEPSTTAEVKSPQRLQMTIPLESQTVNSAVETGPVPEILTPFTYTVQAGDTLGDISQKFYGAANKWPALAEVNRNKVKNNPNWLLVGLKLIIPPTSEAARIMLTLPPPVEDQAPPFPATLPAMNEE